MNELQIAKAVQSSSEPFSRQLEACWLRKQYHLNATDKIQVQTIMHCNLLYLNNLTK